MTWRHSEAQRCAEGAKREERICMQQGSRADAVSAYMEQAGARISLAVEDATTSA